MFKYLANFFHIFSLIFHGKLHTFMLDIIDPPKVKPISSFDGFIIECCSRLQNARVQTCVSVSPMQHVPDMKTNTCVTS